MELVKIIILMLSLSLLFTLCTCKGSPKEKVDNSLGTEDIAKDTAAKANVLLAKARLDSSNYTIYRAEMQVKLANNDRKIKTLKADMNMGNNSMQPSYYKALVALEKQNNKLKPRLADFNESATRKWRDFKTVYNQSMDSVGKSISEISERNINKEK